MGYRVPFLIQLIFVLMQLVTWPFTWLFARGGQYYQYGDTVSAQCQGAGFSIQIGSHVAGWFGRRYMRRQAGQKFRPTRLIIWAPVHHCGSRFAFQLLIFGHGISWATGRERQGSSWAWPGDGFRIV